MSDNARFRSVEVYVIVDNLRPATPKTIRRKMAQGGLSAWWATLCVVDLFGVFPLVALPAAVLACGVYGIPVTLLVLGVQVYTAVLLGRCWRLACALQPSIGKKSRYPYAAVAELACGARTRRLVTVLLDATVFGAGIPNLLVAAQNLQLLTWHALSSDVSYCLWLPVVGCLLCPLVWLGSPKDMKSLVATSVCIVIAVAGCTWACILSEDDANAAPPRRESLTHLPSTRDLMMAYGILAFQFDIHPMLLTIQVDMKDISQINSAIFRGFLVTVSMFAVTTSLAASRYGVEVKSNLLEGLDASGTLYAVTFLVTAQLCLSSAVGNSALFQHVEETLGVPRDFSIYRCLIRTGIVAAAVFLGEAVPRFDVLMGLVGATLTGPLMFVFPPIFFIKLSGMKNNSTAENARADGRIYCSKLTESASLLVRKDYNTFDVQNSEYDETSPAVPRSSVRIVHTNARLTHVPKHRKINVLLSALVIILGVLATGAATYIAWLDAISYAQFSLPCLVNATAAARSYFMN